MQSSSTPASAVRTKRTDSLLSFALATFSAFAAWDLLPGSPSSLTHFLLPAVAAFFTAWLLVPAADARPSPKSRLTLHTLHLGDLSWDRNDFCRGWLITGSTGSGKTECIKLILHSLFTNECGHQDEAGTWITPPWGGISIDAKGDFSDIVLPMAKHYGRGRDVILLSTRPDNAPEGWEPPHRFNLLSDESIPANTYANTIAETAISIGGPEDKGFFKTQAESNIGWAIELCRAVRHAQEAAGDRPEELVFPSLKRVLLLLTDFNYYTDLLTTAGALPQPRPAALPELEPASLRSIGITPSVDGAPAYGPEESFYDERGAITADPMAPPRLASPKLTECLDHFSNRYWSQPPEQLGGVQGTIYNYLNYFAGDDVDEVFCQDNTFDFAEIEQGRILCVQMPQKLAIERRYVNTLIKMLFYQQALRRFDRKESGRRNLLVALQDEVQRVLQQSDGDVDVLRAAHATTIMATQSKSSLYPILGGKEKTEPIILNLRNRVIYTAADESCATGSAEFLGKLEGSRFSTSTGRGGRQRTRNTEDLFVIKPHEFRQLQKFTCIVTHADGRYRKYITAPRTVEGQRPAWWPQAARAARLGPIRWRLLLGYDPDIIRLPVKIPRRAGVSVLQYLGF